MHPLLQSALLEIENATQGMTAEELDFHPEGKWSSAEILEHLALTYELTVKGADRCLAAGANLGGSPTITQRAMQLFVTGLKIFPQGRKSPQRVEPDGTSKGLASLERIRTQLIAMDARLCECSEKLGNSGRLMDHPVLGPLSNRQWCTFHHVHAFHHMKQIRAIRRRLAGR